MKDQLLRDLYHNDKQDGHLYPKNYLDEKLIRALFNSLGQGNEKELERTLEVFTAKQLIYSNDYMINSIIEIFVANNSEEFAESMKNLYIVKNRSTIPNAAALMKYIDSGNVIEFNLGLSTRVDYFCSMLILYEILQFKISPSQNSDYLNVRIERSDLENILEEIKKLLREIKNDKDLEDAALYFDKIGMQSESILEKSPYWYNACINYMIATKAFIIGHEIGHHLLRHTKREIPDLGFLSSIPDDLKAWKVNKNISVQHCMEYQADAYATKLILSIASGPVFPFYEVMPYHMKLGPMITFGVLKQISNPTVSSETHPSLQKRADCVRKILDYELGLKGEYNHITMADIVISFILEGKVS
jgi:hypothetical protein